MMSFILSWGAKLFTGIGLKILAGVAIAGAVLAVLAGAKSAGRNAERVDALKRTLKSVEARNEIENDVARTGGGAARERLRDKWTRD